MKVALVHDFLTQRGGAERVLEVLAEMFPEAPIYTLVARPEQIPEFLRNRTIVESFVARLPFGRRYYKLYLPIFPIAIEQFDFSEFDLVISSSSSFAKGVITKPKTTHISYCYTPMRYVWDNYHGFLCEQKRRRILQILLIPVLHYIRIWDSESAKRVDHFIAISKNVQKRINKYYRREAEVIYPPVNTRRFSTTNEVGDYFLIVSRLLPYKRVDLAIQAFNKLGIRLIIIGDGYDKNRLHSLAGHNITFVGEKSDTSVAGYLRHAKALLLPGEEDFGITAVESQASGTPVVAYGAGGALETVTNHKTGILYNEQTADAIRGAVLKYRTMHFNPRVLQQQAQNFDTNKFKEQIQNFVAGRNFTT